LVKGRALARPSEHSERFEPVVRLSDRTQFVTETLNEKADAAKPEGERGKLFVTVPGIIQLPLIMPIMMVTYWRRGVAGKPTWKEFPEAA